MGDMNWNENDIDELFRDAAKEIKATYDDAYWTEMEALLPQKKKRRFAMWWFTPLLILGGISSVLYFSSKNNLPVTSTAKQNKQLIGKQIETNHSTQTSETLKMVSTENQTNLTEKITPKSNKSVPVDQLNDLIAFQAENDPDEFDHIQNVRENNSDLVEEINTKEQVSQLTYNNFEYFNINNSLIPLNFNMPRPTKLNRFFVEASFGASQAWTMNPEARFQPTWSVNVGYDRLLNKNWYIGANVGIRQTFMNNLELNRSSKVYHFSSSVYQQSISYNEILASNLGLRLGYQKNKHSIELGLQPTYVIGAKMNYETKVNKQITDQKEIWGELIGLRNFQMNTNVTYQYAFSRHFSSGIRFQTGSSILKQNTFINNTRKMPLIGEITFRYSL